MKYYKDSESKLYVLDSGEFEDLLPFDCVEITNVEYLALLPPPPDPRESMSCAAWQLRRALTATGLRESVEAAIAASNQDTRDMWEFATTYKRLHPLVLSLSAALGKTAEETDALFNLALTFEE